VPQHSLSVSLSIFVASIRFIQFHEEGKAFQIADSFSKMLATNCTVVRDGKEQEVGVDVLVPGDIVVVKNGEKIPADMVLILCRSLKVECSALTGEAEPISSSDKVSSTTKSMFDCKNMVFNSSLCFDGMGIGVVVRTGDATAIGTIAKLASDTVQGESTLQREVRTFVERIALISITMAVICFVGSVFIQGAVSINNGGSTESYLLLWERSHTFDLLTQRKL
jgi:sodium/potassium-transporting ATPase subunit alpha